MATPLEELRQLNVSKQKQSRGEPEPVEDITGNTVIQSADTLTDRPTDVQTDGPTDVQTDRPTDPPTDRQASRQARRTVARQPDEAVVKRVRKLGGSRPRAVTVKLPEDIDDYITRYSREHWEEKVLKQDIIKRGLMLAILELETGVELADLD